MNDFNPLDDQPPVSGPRPAAAGSHLATLRERRAAAVKTLHVDLPVPRYDPPLFVRYAPLPSKRLKAIEKRFEKSRAEDKEVLANAAGLEEACLGVFEIDETRRDADRNPLLVSIDPDDRDGEWPKFDERLGQLLGIEHVVNAAEVIRELYLTDGDLIATATKLVNWSGYNVADVEEREGN